MSVYTRGINDANYFRPAFAYVITIAEAFSCLRIPYQTVTLAAGHYKQTRNGAFMEAGINVVLSLLLVKPLGMVGVAIGTLCAMLFRTVQYVTYLSKNILERSLWEFNQRFIVYSITSLAIVAVVKFFPLFPSMPSGSYVKWIVYAVAVTLTSIIITVTAGVLFYREQINDLLLIAARMLKKRTRKTPGETS